MKAKSIVKQSPKRKPAARKPHADIEALGRQLGEDLGKATTPEAISDWLDDLNDCINCGGAVRKALARGISAARPATHALDAAVRKPGPRRTTVAYDDAFMQLEQAHARLDLLLQIIHESGSLDALEGNTQLCTLTALEEDIELIKGLLDEGFSRECGCDHGPWPDIESSKKAGAAQEARP